MSSDFAKAIERELKHIQTQQGISIDKAFLFWFATNILEIDEIAALEAISVEGANDKGIDLFYVDEDNERAFIAQGKYSSDLSYRAKEKDLDKLMASLNWLASPEALKREGKPELAQAANDYLDAQKQGYGIELIYVYTGKKTNNIEKGVLVYNQNEENIQKSRALRHYHVDLLKDLWDEIQGGRQRIKGEKIKIFGGCSEIKGNFGSALTTTVPCSEIVRLYQNHGDKLFDRNVRLFLGAHKGSVNAGIAATIKDPKDRENFWAYNNGITVICDAYKHRGNTVTLSNFSIVNGCQTAVSLAENEGVSAEMFVLVRFIAAAAELVDNIIWNTNSQNPIRSWDIASQKKTQRRLKTDFEKLKKPYIYLTRRGDKPKGPLNEFREDGKLRKIQIDVLGQYMAAFKGNPVLAYKHKAFIFSKHHDETFPPDISVEDALFVWICGETCKVTALEMIKENSENARILKKGGALFTLAVLSEIAKTRNGITYMSKISEEQTNSNKAKGRVQKYAKYAAMLYLSAVRDEEEIQRDELATLIRQKEFYDKVLNRVKRLYNKDSLNSDWLKGTLPNL